MYERLLASVLVNPVILAVGQDDRASWLPVLLKTRSTAEDQHRKASTLAVLALRTMDWDTLILAVH